MPIILILFIASGLLIYVALIVILSLMLSEIFQFKKNFQSGIELMTSQQQSLANLAIVNYLARKI